MKQLRIDPLFLLAGLLALGVGLFLVLYLLKYVWLFGMALTPFLLIVTFFINKQPIIDYANTIGNTFWNNPLRGIFYAALTLLVLPFVVLFLLGKALFINKLGDLQKEQFGNNGNLFEAINGFNTTQAESGNSSSHETYSDYEEVETTIK